MALNKEALQETMNYINAHPEQHDQAEWAYKDNACGTAGCFAGWHLLLTGQATFTKTRNDYFPENSPHAYYDDFHLVQVTPELREQTPDWTDRERETAFSLAARMSLGLTPSQADVLFDDIWTTQEVYTIVERILQGVSPNDIGADLLAARDDDDDDDEDSW